MSALSLPFLSEKDPINVLSLSNIHTATLNEPRAWSVGFDGPPREEWDRAHATDDATGPITLHLLFSKTTRVAAPGATSLILALSSHGQQVSTRGALGCGGRRTSVLRVEERGRQGKSARGRNERGRHLRRTDPTMKFDLREISLPEVGQDVAVAVEFWATTAGDRIMTRRWHGSLWTRSGYSLYSKCRKTAAQV